MNEQPFPNQSRWTRRQALGTLAAGLVSSQAWTLLGADDKAKSFRIGACDWSIGKRQDLSALALAKEIGLDGVQVSFDEPGKKWDLREAEVRKAYAAESKKQGVAVASLAMGVLNNVPYSSDPRAEKWVSDCIDVMELMGQKLVLLAFFGKGDIKNKPELQKAVVKRLKAVAPKAEKAGVVIGLETWLSADEHMSIIDRVGSPNVQVYYDTANSNKMGYDIYKEIRQLGRKHICELHCKENGAILGHGRVDFRRIREAIDDIGYRGWLIIEGAVGGGLGTVDAYKHNTRYLKTLFPD